MSISIGFLILINKYLFESKLFHFLLGTICSQIFVGKKFLYFITPNCEDPIGIMQFLRHCGLQDKCNIGLLMVNIEFIWWGWETGWKTSFRPIYVGQKPIRACVVLLFKMLTINKTYLIFVYEFEGIDSITSDYNNIFILITIYYTYM